MALSILSRTTWMSQYQKKHTIVVISHPLSASSISYDPWYTPCSIYVPHSLFAQSPKFSLVYLFAWHPELHTGTPYISSPTSFCSTCPYHHGLFWCSTKIMSSNPILSLNPLLGTLSCSLAPHIHLTILISARWSAFIPLHFPCNRFRQLVHCIELLPMPLPQTLHGHLTAFCVTFCRSPPWFCLYLISCLYSSRYPSTH